jgi:glycosyltransferase involved in cell wall biosynthesis
MTTSFPKVSIITPSYNQARYLEQCILSVLEQDYPNIEYIIMDGGSTDGSVEIIKKYASRLAYWVTQKDGGQSAALNEGLHHATGEIWAWMNADDAYLPGAVSKAVSWFASRLDCDIVFGDFRTIDENGKNAHNHRAREFDFSFALTKQVPIPSGSTFIRRAVRERVGKFDESLHYVMDIDYWLRASLVASFGYLPETLSQYRIHPRAKTFDKCQSELRGAEIVRAYLLFWNRQDIPYSLRHFQSRSLANIFLYAADLACASGNRPLCLRYIGKGFLLGKTAIFQPRLLRLFIQMFFSTQIVDILRQFFLIKEARK